MRPRFETRCDDARADHRGKQQRRADELGGDGPCPIDGLAHLQQLSPQHDRGILFSDPALGIDWQVDVKDVILSDKDRKQPLMSEAPDLFP